MNCLGVRERLPEYALSSLPEGDAGMVARHLAWCAACRKESAELHEAAATFAYAAAPTMPDDDLEDRLVGAIRARARRHSSAHRRIRRAFAVALVATVVAVLVSASSLWWGTVVARREDRDASRADLRRAELLAEQRFEQVWANLPFRLPEDQARFATLAAPDGAAGQGWGFVIASAARKDVAGVEVGGMPSADRHLPYGVWATFARGRRVLIGRIRTVDRSGAAVMFRRVERDLEGVTNLIVRAADGRVALNGAVAANA